MDIFIMVTDKIYFLKWAHIIMILYLFFFLQLVPLPIPFLVNLLVTLVFVNTTKQMFGKKGYPNNHFCMKNGYCTKHFLMMFCFFTAEV